MADACGSLRLKGWQILLVNILDICTTDLFPIQEMIFLHLPLHSFSPGPPQDVSSVMCVMWSCDIPSILAWVSPKKKASTVSIHSGGFILGANIYFPTGEKLNSIRSLRRLAAEFSEGRSSHDGPEWFYSPVFAFSLTISNLFKC